MALNSKKKKQKATYTETDRKPGQTVKPAETTGPANDETVRTKQTPDWSVSSPKPAGLDQNEYRTATLDVMPESVAGVHGRQVPPEQSFALSTKPNIQKATHSYTQPDRG